jgi:hypothetical protein
MMNCARLSIEHTLSLGPLRRLLASVSMEEISRVRPEEYSIKSTLDRTNLDSASPILHIPSSFASWHLLLGLYHRVSTMFFEKIDFVVELNW